ncbi:MAG: DUF2723 domain-containing protein [Candidatus Promineifilaceae bacterium]
MKNRQTLIAATALTIEVSLFYLATLAPTVLWGDDAFFQWSAAVDYLQPDGGGHWLYFNLARLFVHFPVGDIAYRVNLLSAAAATLTILLVFATGRSLGLSNPAAVVGALSLAVAHTFWTHAVRAEVYTVFTLMLALILWLTASWREERPIFLYTAAFLFGPTLLSHQMGLLLLPTFGLLLWLRRGWLQNKEWLFTGTAFVTGLGLGAWIIQIQVGQSTLFDNLFTYLTQSGADFSGSIFAFSFSQLPADIGFWLVMLGLQFVGPAFLLGILGAWDMRKNALVELPFLLFYLMTVLFAATYRVNDRYVFFLPGYLIFALMVGTGWERIEHDRPKVAYAILPLLALVPILTYALLPPLLQTTGVSIPDARNLPGREPLSFFLWPAKGDYTEAADFGRSALNSLPPDSILVADHTPLQTLTYLQKVEGLRPDVLLVEVSPGDSLAPIWKRYHENQAIYLADDNPDYYNLSSITDGTLVPEGYVYRLNGS